MSSMETETETDLQPEKKYKCQCGCGQNVQTRAGLISGHLSGIEKRRLKLAQKHSEDAQKLEEEEAVLNNDTAVAPSEIPPEQKSEITKQYLNIMDVHPYVAMDNIVAWFNDEKGNKISKMPGYRGLLVNIERKESIPIVLIISGEGTFLPPFVMAGFLGMFPEDQIFPEPETEPVQITQEGQNVKICQEEDPEPEVRKSESQLPPAKIESLLKAEPEPKKKGFLGGVFKKKKAEQEPPKEISKETKDLLTQLVNASK
jgi:hypothetical protein